MNPTQVGGIFRDIIKAVGVIFVVNGYIDGGMLEMIGGVAATLAGSVWSWYTNKTTSMISAVAASDKVAKVVTTPAVAAADPSPKVVSH